MATAGTNHPDRGRHRSASRATTGRYTQTALRLSTANALVPGGLARIDLASAVVGPDSVSLLGPVRARDR